MMTISLEQAKIDVAGITTKQGLLDFLKTISGEVAGATKDTTYLLYSGPMEDGSWSTQAVTEMRRFHSTEAAFW